MAGQLPKRKIRYAIDPDTGDERKPFEWQTAFHRSPARFKGFSGPVGSGKSRALCSEALKLAYLNRGRTGVIGAPTYPMLRDSTRASFLEILEENRIPYRLHKSENSIYLPEARSTILFRALDSFERIRGTNLSWFGVDELTYCKPQSWLRLEARLRDPKATHLCGFGSWTPKGFDWVYDRFIGPDRKPGYEAFRARQNPTLGDYYQRLQESYDPRFFQQEAEGEYLNVFSGQVYYPFNRKDHLRQIEYSPAHPIWWALDFNVNPMCSVIGQTYGGIIRVLDELVLSNSNTLAACEEFLARTAHMLAARKVPEVPEDWLEQQGVGYPLDPPAPLNVYVYGDPAGTQRKTSSSRTDWQIVREFFGRYTDKFKVQLRVPEAHPLVKDRVNCVNAMLLNYAGEKRMYLDSKCRELAKDFEQLAWKADPNGNPLSELNKSDPMRSHLSDALGYMIVREFPMKRKAGERSGPPLV